MHCVKNCESHTSKAKSLRKFNNPLTVLTYTESILLTFKLSKGDGFLSASAALSNSYII